MSEEVAVVDSRAFHRRAGHVLKQLKESKNTEEDGYRGVDGVLCVIDDPDEENPYTKSASLHNWLLGYEFPRTIIFISKDKFHFLTSPKKVSVLEKVKGGAVPVEFYRRTKDAENNKHQFEELIKAIKESGNRIGVFTKEKPKGKMYNEWLEYFNKENFEQVDVAAGAAASMSLKEDEEIKNIHAAAKASSFMMTKTFVNEMSRVIDEEARMSHSKLSEIIESKIDNPNFLKSKAAKQDADFDPSIVEWCYSPIIQSGGVYDLKPSAVPDDRQIHGGVILSSLGLRYKSYCSNIARTFLIDPNSSQEKTYEFVVQLQKKVLETIKDGAVFSDVYNAALGHIRAKRPELEKHFVRSMGAGIGIEFRDSSLNINAKNNKKMKSGMTLCLSLGFNDIDNPKPQDSKSKRYSLLLIDTIRVTSDGYTMLTDSPKTAGEVSFWFKEEEEDEDMQDLEDSKEDVKRPQRGAAAAASVGGKRTRNSEKGRNVDESAEQRRKEHQKELANRIQEAGLAKYQEGAEVTNGTDKPVFKKYESYKRDSQLPAAINDLQVMVDVRAQSIIVPIQGRPVPFHISTLKNVSKNDEGDYVYLRLNFVTPGQGLVRKDDQPFDDADATFIRSLTYRSADTQRFAQLFAAIQDMKKNATKREAERKEMADIVEQDNLVEVKNRRPQTLPDIYARPALDGKRVPGQLEIHQNGMRYQSPLRADHRIDVLFSNIRHLFYQPCEHELIVVIHMHLKSPIMVGKRKTYDIQVYREASDVQYDETGNKKRKYRYGDEDELEQEQEERRRRAQLNKEFRNFSEKIAEASDGKLDVDIPFRELGFSGVPHRGNVLLQPTTDCLVQLIDPPFTVITLSEVEIAHLERVQFGLKNFDMVFVFKDYKKPPAHINTIPVQQLDNVKDWLDSVDIPFSEGPLNLNWATIMKTVNEDPVAFFQTGGWGFLGTDSDEEDESSEAESEFAASGSDFDEDESEDEESDFDEEASADSGSEMDEDEEEGEDWDELEKRASKADSRHADSDRPVKRKK